MVNRQVVKHHHYSPVFALVLQADQEVLELRLVVVLLRDVGVHEAALLADGGDHGDGGSALLDHGQLHASAEPALGDLHLHIESRLVNVQDLVVGALFDDGAQLLNELQLPLAELLILDHALPELVVGPLVLDTMLEIDFAKALSVKLHEVEALHDDLAGLL